LQHIGSFVEWLIGQLRRPSNPNKSVPIVTSVLAVLLKERWVLRAKLAFKCLARRVMSVLGVLLVLLKERWVLRAKLGI